MQNCVKIILIGSKISDFYSGMHFYTKRPKFFQCTCECGGIRYKNLPLHKAWALISWSKQSVLLFSINKCHLISFACINSLYSFQYIICTIFLHRGQFLWWLEEMNLGIWIQQNTINERMHQCYPCMYDEKPQHQMKVNENMMLHNGTLRFFDPWICFTSSGVHQWVTFFILQTVLLQPEIE